MGVHRRLRTSRSRVAAVSTGAALAITAVAAAAPSASAADNPGDQLGALVNSTGHWAPAATATIHPGVVTLTKDAQCTANFIYTSGGHTYLGQAAHCSGTGQSTDTNGCTSKSLPLGTPVGILGSGVTGKLVYNSWLLMQKNGEKDENACAYNDLALIEIPSSAVSKVNPSIPVFGGPTGLNTTGTQPGDTVVSYGNSPLRQGIALLSPKTGASIGDTGDGWSHSVYTLTPGVPGDSGSAFLDGSGRALGDLSTLSLAPTPLSNQVSDLAHELAYARAHTDMKDLRLVAGTEQFQGATL
ncbi:MAG TPA: serine protease [Sporichthyaceae bacterium]|nr:serine protease [Sporichthyaceae bacterium]